MTKEERELLFLLAHSEVIDIKNELQRANMSPDEGRGGSTIRRIQELVSQINEQEKGI